MLHKLWEPSLQRKKFIRQTLHNAVRSHLLKKSLKENFIFCAVRDRGYKKGGYKMETLVRNDLNVNIYIYTKTFLKVQSCKMKKH